LDQAITFRTCSREVSCSNWIYWDFTWFSLAQPGNYWMLQITPLSAPSTSSLIWYSSTVFLHNVNTEAISVFIGAYRKTKNRTANSSVSAWTKVNLSLSLSLSLLMTRKRSSLYEQAISAELNNNDTSEPLAHQFICNEDDPVRIYALVRGLKPPFQQLISSNQGRGKGTARGLHDFVLGDGSAEANCSRLRDTHVRGKIVTRFEGQRGLIRLGLYTENYKLRSWRWSWFTTNGQSACLS
jgi:hypothetical protein